jgi:hypothetical protein
MIIMRFDLWQTMRPFRNLVHYTKISKPMILLWQTMHHIFGFEKGPLAGYCSSFWKAHVNEF